MNVGILSMQKVMNYGSFLQAFALKKTIEGWGHQCEFVDIERGVIFPELKLTIFFFLKKALERYFKWNILTRICYTRIFQRRFREDFFRLLGVDIHCMQHFNAVVIGSDEVFNFAQRTPWGYTPQLYGKITNADRVISYAGSFGHTTMKDIEHYELKDEIANSMKTMQSISVRDTNSFNIVKELTGKESIINVDPVLMFDYSPYIKSVDKKNFIIIYTYPNRIKDKKEIAAIRAFAHKYNKKIISIGFYFPWCDETVIPDPFEVLGYLREADFVITDTFHGTVMSLKFNKKFATLVRSTNVEKIMSLLSQFHLEKRSVDDISELEETLLSSSDYDFVNNELSKEKQRSYNYLKQHLTEEVK